jgi:hypothetical protein
MIAWSLRPGLPSLGDNGAFCHPGRRAFSLSGVERPEDGCAERRPVSYPQVLGKGGNTDVGADSTQRAQRAQ